MISKYSASIKFSRIILYFSSLTTVEKDKTIVEYLKWNALNPLFEYAYKWWNIRCMKLSAKNYIYFNRLIWCDKTLPLGFGNNILTGNTCMQQLLAISKQVNNFLSKPVISVYIMNWLIASAANIFIIWNKNIQS